MNTNHLDTPELRFECVRLACEYFEGDSDTLTGIAEDIRKFVLAESDVPAARDELKEPNETP